jgi:oligopeptide transport system substrate-binding protein
MMLIVMSTMVIPFINCPQVQASAVNSENQHITIALTQEPPNLNTMRTTDLVSFFIVGHVMEGLLRYDRRGNLAGGVAESWDVKDQTVTFHLRDDARWSDGKPVTADDFAFAWRKMVDPSFAAPYATILFPISNAEAIHRGEMQPDALGVEVIDSRTLQVTLEVPLAYFPGLMVHLAYFPVREEFYNRQKERYGAEPENLLYNGPFKLSSWVHGASLRMDKNPDYWNADNTSLNRIDIGYITADNRSRLNLFRDNAIAVARLDAETVKEAINQKLKVKTFVTGGISYLSLNVKEGHATRQLPLRKAIQSVLDPQVFVNKVIAVPGYKPAYSFFPSWINGVENKLITEYPPLTDMYNPANAVVYLEEARRSFEGGTIPSLTLLTVSSPTGMKVAEYLQSVFKTQLDLDVKIDNQTFKQYLVKANAGDFDIAISSWFPDYDDVMTYADLLASWNPNNRGGYKSAEYDQWLSVVQRSSSRTERMEAAAKLQHLIQKDAIVLPLMETGSAFVAHEKLKGLVRRVIGPDPDYTFARVIK